MKFFIKYFFSKCDQIRRKLRIWPYLLKKSLIRNFIFCAVSASEFLMHNLHARESTHVLTKWQFYKKQLNLESVTNYLLRFEKLLFLTIGNEIIDKRAWC